MHIDLQLQPQISNLKNLMTDLRRTIWDGAVSQDPAGNSGSRVGAVWRAQRRKSGSQFNLIFILTYTFIIQRHGQRDI
jgi:hypothetical protein